LTHQFLYALVLYLRFLKQKLQWGDVDRLNI
jgi:hypothetical protein